MSSDSEGQVSSSDEDNSNDSDFVPEKKPAARPPAKEKGAKAPRPAARSSKAPAVKKEKKAGTTAPRKRQPAVKKTPAAPKPKKKKADDDGKASDAPKARKPRAPRRKRAAEDESDEGREAFDDDDEGAEEDEHTDDEERGTGRRKRGRKRKATADVKADETLLKIKELAVDLARKKEAGEELPTLKALGFDNVREVAHMAPEKVIFEVEKLFVECARSILQGQGFGFTVPTRAAGNQMYIPELDRIVLKDKAARRTFLNHREVRKTAITTRILQLVHEVLSKGIHITKRDMFYTDVKLFKDQRDSDVVLEDVSCAIGCTRSSLHVVASEKGLVVGRISFMEDGDPIDCSRMGVGGKAIPPFIDRITNIQSDAEFILVVEKEAAYLRIAEDRFYNKFKCIVITAKGQPDVSTRLFLRKIKTALNIPVLGLMDADPYGLKILSVYMTGSKNMSYDSASLTTSDIKWLGVRPSDLDKYNIPEQCRLDMTAEDIKQGQRLLEEEFIQKNPAWVKELEMMLQTKKKAEIQALSAFGFQYITESYLPRKLKKGDWI